MQEIWKDVIGYEGLYQVSNLGRVKSQERLKPHPSGNGYLPIHEKILHQSKNTWGYSQVTLFRNQHGCNLTVHRLAAKAFLANPCGLPQVNHKDENKSNNRIDNLEWCTRKYNVNYGTRNLRAGAKRSKAVIQLNLDGTQVAKFHSARQAAQITNLSYKNISACCIGTKKTHGQYKWKFDKSA